MHIVMKVTKACNLRCAYCYVDQDSTELMPVSLVETTIDKFGKHFREINFLWHGGEPLLAGVDFYQQVVEAQKRYTATYGVTFKNELQTNGTLLNDEWIQFLVANNFSFGISYDGPGQLNGYRVDRNGNSVITDYQSLFIKLRAEYNLFTGVLCVVNPLNVAMPETIFSHFKELQIDTVNFSPYLGGRSEVAAITADQFFTFYKNIFDLWVRDRTPFNAISVLSDIIYNLVNIVYKQGCTWSGSCFRSNLAILPDGKIFPCLTLKDSGHCIGNIWKGSVADILRNANYLQAWLAQKTVIAECAPCVYFDVCRGGCRAAALRMLGRLGEKDPFCEGRKKLIKHIFVNIYSDITGIPGSKINSLLNEADGFLKLRLDLIKRLIVLEPDIITSPALVGVIELYRENSVCTRPIVNV